MIGVGARAKWPPGERNGPGAPASASEAKDIFHTDTVPDTARRGKPAPLSVIVADLICNIGADLPGRLDRSWLCDQPLEFNWRDAERLGACWLSLWMGNVRRVICEDRELAEWLYDKLEAEGVLEHPPEIRMRGKCSE